MANKEELLARLQEEKPAMEVSGLILCIWKQSNSKRYFLNDQRR